ncbi:unnamed protein product [Adineta steineri]|uniref:NADP-dependent oxidoreductase domain-containing protein n=1 Tax=Adineta steineri TaxID=433720 RepID=A0A814ZPP6_9BILA|nr:unnamed protein product [Adineta steineri]
MKLGQIAYFPPSRFYLPDRFHLPDRLHHYLEKIFFVIPGTTKIKNLEENVGAAGVKLSKEEEQEIRQACENADIAGGRYAEAVDSLLYGDSAPKRT